MPLTKEQFDRIRDSSKIVERGKLHPVEDRTVKDVAGVKIDVSHSEMFEFGHTLALNLGCKEILIEPRIETQGGYNQPDIVGIRDGEKPLVIVECERSFGNIVLSGGPVERLSSNVKLRQIAEFHFILRTTVGVPRILELFPNMPESNIHFLGELLKKNA